MNTSKSAPDRLVVSEAASMLGPIHVFGSGCFFVFGIIYLLFVHSWYLFLSTFFFGILSASNWFIFRQPSLQGLRVMTFLTIVYTGLVNVAVHLGAGPMPMVFWGMSISIAGAFLLNLRGILLWVGMVSLFYPLIVFLKNGPLSSRVIPLDFFQTELLGVATYAGLVAFLAYTFVLFRMRLDKAIAARDEHLSALRSSELQRISEGASAETERRQLESRLFQAQKLESLGVMAGGVAHDFSNLLTGILGNLSLAQSLVKKGAITELNDALKTAETASLRAAELTRQMLTFSGRGCSVSQPLDLNAILCEMVELLKSNVSKLILIHFELNSRAPWIKADPSQIRQIVMNLIINAAEAIGNQAGVITLRTGIVHLQDGELSTGYSVDFLRAGDYVYLEVIDTGCGMDESIKSRIFDPFFTTKFTGRGLGLAGVLGILKGHQSAIMVDSNPGKGTTFRLVFPQGLPAGEITPDSIQPPAGTRSG